MVSNIVLIVVLTLLNAFFAMSEIAFISLNDLKVDKMAEGGNKKAKVIKKMLDDPSKFLATIQIGITLAGFLASAFAAESFASELVPLLSFIPLNQVILNKIAVILITVILSYFTLVFGELVPKKIGMRYYEKIAFSVVGSLNFIYHFTKPFVWLLSASTNLVTKILGIKEAEEEGVTEEEIKMMVDIGEEKGTIEEKEKEMINNVFDFNDKTVGEVMVPRVDVVALELETPNEEAIKVINENKFSRIPIYKDNIDNILGTLHVRDLITYIYHEDKMNFAEIMREPLFVPEKKKIHNVFAEMQTNKQSIAIVVDEYGGTAGIVTIEDIIEEIVGDISDEFDDDELEYEKIDDNTYIIDGSLKVYEVERIFEVEIDDKDNDTISGLLLDKLGDFPSPEDDLDIEIGTLSFHILEYDDKKINKIKVCNNIEMKNDEEFEE